MRLAGKRRGGGRGRRKARAAVLPAVSYRMIDPTRDRVVPKPPPCFQWPQRVPEKQNGRAVRPLVGTSWFGTFCVMEHVPALEYAASSVMKGIHSAHLLQSGTVTS